MSDTTKNVLLLFQRPLEPLFTKKDNGTAAFDVPENFYTERYKPLGTQLNSRFGEDVETRIPLKEIAPLNLEFTTQVKVDGTFSLFNRSHKLIAGELIKLLMDAPDNDTFLARAAYAKDRCNPYLYQYALSVATQHRPETKHLNLPPIVETFPDQFVSSNVFPKAREELSVVNEGDRMDIEIPRNYTASDKETEQRLAYFREDIGVNMHHWHWHLVYPGEGEDAIVKKDRRGELFYYMHNQIIARYNVERLCNNLGRVKPLSNLRESLPEGYFPKLIRSSNNRAYPPRVSNATLNDVNREVDGVSVEVGDLERWRDRIFQAIDQGYVETQGGNKIPLDEVKGIDILGDIVESSKLSPNPQLYGSLHNEGHNVISYIHDPEARHLEDFGVMGDVSTAMRDPIFYRWHSFIDGVFLKHKNTLPQYDPSKHFEFPGISVDSVNVQISTKAAAPPNSLLTYWQKSNVDLSAGLDFGPNGNVYATFTHLQHAPFNYVITATNTSGALRRGTCRIFMGPKIDERGSALTFRDQRSLMIEMDKFDVILHPGSNTIPRRSDESSVTIPYERSFRKIGTKNQPSDPVAAKNFQFCGCGWPQHMLLPKGKTDGADFDIFVMISNYNDDTVHEEVDKSFSCNDAASFCGLKDQKYPDRRGMGFPFDRKNSAATLDDFANLTTNMVLGSCKIRHVNTLVPATR